VLALIVTFSIHFMTSIVVALIERDSDVIVIVIVQQLLQRLRESLDRVFRHARGVGQTADREVGAINVVGAVDDEERWLPSHERADYRTEFKGLRTQD